jgi:hypothetical protein
VSHVKYELDSYISEDDILHCHYRGPLEAYIIERYLVKLAYSCLNAAFQLLYSIDIRDKFETDCDSAPNIFPPT